MAKNRTEPNFYNTRFDSLPPNFLQQGMEESLLRPLAAELEVKVAVLFY
jgi:hypothetical protein